MKSPRLGYALTGEEHAAADLLKHAAAAEQTGFSFTFLSDTFHPWTSTQGNSPFAWSVLGALSQSTKAITIGTAATCPIFRYHPTIVAQAAASVASLMEGRFLLGLTTGESINEHTFGEAWPPLEVRQEMLVEAIEVIRLMWSGELQSYWGEYFVVDKARIYSLPQTLPPILVSATEFGSAALAGELADGLIGSAPDKELVATFNETGGKGKPKYAKVTVCYASSVSEAQETARAHWPNAAIDAHLLPELRLPQYVESISSMVSSDLIAETVVCGPDPKRYIAKIKEYAAAGYDHVYIHQIGPQQGPFFRFFEKEILPHFS